MLLKNCSLIKPTIVISLFLPIFFAAFMTSQSKTLAIKYEFEYPKISSVSIDGNIYDQINMSGLTNTGLPGHPKVPVKDARILIPFGTEVTNIEVIFDRKIKVEGSFLIEPGQKAYPIFTNPLTIHPEAINQDIYESSALYPAERIREISVQTFRGYRILILNIFPIEYIPSQRDLFYYPELTVVVQTQQNDCRSVLFRGIDSDNNEVMAKVDNPEMVYSYNDVPKNGGKNFDLLIITIPLLLDYFMPLKEYHDTTGIITDLVTTDQIGGNDPDMIRDYIRDRYLADGIEYLLIGGDDDLIPAKDLFVEAWWYVENIPADLYFGCLDGTFNFDGDDRWGEPSDGDGGGDVDLVAEVFVGRAPVGNPAEAYTFVEKTIRYINSNESYLNKSLMVGEDLGHPGVQQFGGDMLAKLIDSSSSNGYRTIGLPSNLYSIDSLYDRDWPSYYWPASEIIELINDEQHIINHMGHSNNGYNMKLTPSDIGLLHNDHLFLIYSQGCLAGSFDSANDCMAEYFTVKTSNGAFAALMNARYGWKEFFKHVNTTDGPNQRYQREFWDAVFNPLENMPELGRANQDSKEDNLYRINEGAMRWVYYQMNLFGDPTVAIKRFSSIMFEFPVGLPFEGTANQETTFEMEISGLYGGIPIPESGQLHFSISGGDFQTIQLPEISPNIYEVTFPAIDCADSIEFYFSAEEVNCGRIYYPQTGAPFVYTVIDSIVTIFFDDFEDFNGWMVTRGQWQRDIPTGAGGEYGRPDPSSAYSGSKIIGYNLDGDYENNLSSMHVISPPINCSEHENVILKFMRWLNVEETPYDFATISISDDFLIWDTVWQNIGFIMDSAWKEIELNVTEFAAHQDTVYFRWTMGPTNESWRYSGWNIDDVEIYSIICNDQPAICGDCNSDELINILDISFLIAYLYLDGQAPFPLEIADVNNDGTVNLLDITYLIAYLYQGGPEPACF